MSKLQEDVKDFNPVDYIEFDPKYAEPSDNKLLVGDTTKANKAFEFKLEVTLHHQIKLIVENSDGELKHNPIL